MKKRFQLLAVLALAFPLLASAHGPTRQKVKEKITINAPADKVWAVVKDFGGVDKWLPPVKKVTMSDEKTRVLNVGSADGPTVTEILKKINDDNMTLKYRIEKMDVVKTIDFNGEKAEYHVLPVNNYSSKLQVKATDDGKSIVTWQGAFYREWVLNPPWPEGQGDAEAKSAISGLYKAGLENLKKVIEK